MALQGGIAFEVEEGDPTSRIALVTFTSQEACDAAAVVADMAPTEVSVQMVLPANLGSVGTRSAPSLMQMLTDWNPEL